MGISNSIGSNTFDILLCLGLPWFIKATWMPTIPGKRWVGINSAGIEYSAISLLSTLLMLYTAFALNKFQLDKRVGRVCLLMYAVFLILASLIELNAFFRVNLPTCGRWTTLKIIFLNRIGTIRDCKLKIISLSAFVKSNERELIVMKRSIQSTINYYMTRIKTEVVSSIFIFLGTSFNNISSTVIN